jgi:hypothetical protein
LCRMLAAKVAVKSSKTARRTGTVMSRDTRGRGMDGLYSCKAAAKSIV